MRDSVARAFFNFTIQFEGYTRWMYLDEKGLVTTAVGNLIDSPAAAGALPWKHADGTPADAGEVYAEWSGVKWRTDLAKRGGGAFEKITKLRLSEGDVRDLVAKKLNQNEAQLKKTFRTFDTWPADAQLAIHSWAWAVGTNAHWPNLHAALNRAKPDFVAAAAEISIRDSGNPVEGRNAANVLLMWNAHWVQADQKDYSKLYYPIDLRAYHPPQSDSQS